MKNTTNYGFNLPESIDFYDIEHINENFTEVDEKLKSVEDTTSGVSKSVESLENGTTPVGNALKLNGLTAEEFVKGKLSFFQEGETILSWALNPNGEYKKMVAGGYYPEDTPTQTEGFVELLYTDFRIKVKYIEYIDRQRIWSRSIFGGTWYNEWTLDKDGGNADTVDGYHASDLMKFVGTVDASYINAYVAKNPYLAHIIPDTAVAVGLPSQYYRVQFIPDTSNNYGTEIAFPVYGGSLYFRVCDNGVWKPWSTEFLPLTGGILSGDIMVKSNNPRLIAYNSETGNIVNLESTSSNRRGLWDETNVRWIIVEDADGEIKTSTNNNAEFYKFLHTGNSLKVQASNSNTAPDDDAVWLVTS